MHRPGYVQGGQEANRGYLLLGVYHRRIPGDTTGVNDTGDKLLVFSGVNDTGEKFIAGVD